MLPQVYSAHWCSDCEHLKALLTELNISYETRDIQMAPQNKAELKEAIGKEAVPHIRLGEEWLKAYGPGFGKEELLAWLELYQDSKAKRDILNKAFVRAKEIILQAGQYALTKQKEIQNIEYKAEKDVVTEVDHKIRKELSEAFPEHNLLTEESPDLDLGSDWTWVVDPIDGTVNYSHGLPIWGISIALLFRGKPALALMNLPASGELFTAIRGRGAFLNQHKIQVSSVFETKKAIISNGDFNVGPEEKIPALNQKVLQQMEKQIPTFQRVKSYGSAIWESAQVACGRLDAYSMAISHPWDIAAGALIVQEAGGKVTHQEGTPLQIKDLCNALFTNGWIHEQTLTCF